MTFLFVPAKGGGGERGGYASGGADRACRQHLAGAALRGPDDGPHSDSNGVQATFLVGLREVTALNDANNNVVMRVNRKRILVRGGGWSPDLLQRATRKRTAQQLLLTRDIGLNAIRLEGKLQDDDLFEQASAMGLMVLPGICCCDAWQQWNSWTNHTHVKLRAPLATPTCFFIGGCIPLC